MNYLLPFTYLRNAAFPPSFVPISSLPVPSYPVPASSSLSLSPSCSFLFIPRHLPVNFCPIPTSSIALPPLTASSHASPHRPLQLSQVQFTVNFFPRLKAHSSSVSCFPPHYRARFTASRAVSVHLRPAGGANTRGIGGGGDVGGVTHLPLYLTQA